MTWGDPIEVEVRSRIQLTIWAYAYEFEAISLVPDAQFDGDAALLDRNFETGNKQLDTFFKNEFNPSTGLWIRRHPELAKIKKIYETYYKGRATC